MDDTLRVELIELYGVLQAAVGTVARAVERVEPVSGASGRASPDGDVRGARSTGSGGAAEPRPAVPADPATDQDDQEQEVEASIRRMRQAMLEALFVLDFVVVHRRLDRLMLRRVRTAVVGGIDSADACLEEAAAGPGNSA